MCGGMHYDSVQSRLCLMRALQQWDALSDEEQAGAHPVTVHMCRPGGEVRAQLQVYLAEHAGEIDGYPLLCEQLSRLAFIPLVELSIERKHAMIKQELHHGPHSGPAALSLVHRYPALVQWLDKEPKNLEERKLDNFHKIN